jgi:hypothetical protein
MKSSSTPVAATHQRHYAAPFFLCTFLNGKKGQGNKLLPVFNFAEFLSCFMQ